MTGIITDVFSAIVSQVTQRINVALYLIDLSFILIFSIVICKKTFVCGYGLTLFQSPLLQANLIVF